MARSADQIPYGYQQKRRYFFKALLVRRLRTFFGGFRTNQEIIWRVIIGQYYSCRPRLDASCRKQGDGLGRKTLPAD
jgi:hypothetical protein